MFTINIKWIISTHYFKWPPFLRWLAYLRKCHNTLMCEHDQGKLTELTCLNLYPPQKRGNLCNEREQWQRNRQPVHWGLCCLCLFLTSSPKEMQIEAKRWTPCAAGHSMSLVLWLEAPNPSRGQLIKPGELGSTLLRYFASLGSESILALWLWWRLGFQSEFLSRPPRPHIIVASIR